MNRVILLGNLAKEPQFTYLPDGKAIAFLFLVTVDDEEIERHTILVSGVNAEAAAVLFKEGSMLYIEGRLSTSHFGNKKGMPVMVVVDEPDVIQLIS